MTIPGRSLYDCPADEVTYADIERFVAEAVASGLPGESTTVEFKEKRSGLNVAEAVAAMANTDGGLIFIGIADKGPYDERIAGIAAAQLDGLIDHLRSFFTPLPDVVPVAMPTRDDRIVVVIRVDADEYLHPVVVSGRVVYRVPGSTVSADRRKILDLLSRDHHNSSAGLPDAPRDPSRMDLWGSSEPGFPAQATAFHLDLRVTGGAQLPASLSARPWLSSAALSAALTALADSYQPNSLGRPEFGYTQSVDWRVRDRRSTWMSLTVASPTDMANGLTIDAAAHISVAGRQLVGTVGLRLVNPGPVAIALRLENLFDALQLQVFMLRRVFSEISSALGASRPVTPAPWQAWLRCGRNFTVPDLVEVSAFTRDSDSLPAELVFVPMDAGSWTDDVVIELVRNWLEVALLDLGLRDFEAELDRITSDRG